MTVVDAREGWVSTDEVFAGRAGEAFEPLREFPQLTRYSAWRAVGSGAFAQVFAGVHAGLARVEAVKRVAIADPVVRRLALDEARVLAALPPHPNLVGTYDAEARGEAFFLTLQFLPGRPLDQEAMPTSIERAIAVVRDVCEALALVHAHGAVHRDVKPNNLFATLHGHVVLGDFGVARPLAEFDAPGRVAGTPAYMAPEAFAGEASAQTDLWSVGVTLYELLTGQRPFPQVKGLPLGQVREALSRAQLDLPSAIRLGVPHRLDDLVVQLLSYHPIDRPRTALAVLDQLPRYDTVVAAVEGDLASMPVDALAVAATTDLRPDTPGSLARAVADAAGASMVTEAQRRAPAPVGSVVDTSAGDLEARHVFHAVLFARGADGALVAPAERDVRKAAWACLRRAHELRLRAIAIPALGAELGAVSIEDAARILVDVTHAYLLEFRPRLERVVFALESDAAVRAFSAAAIERGMVLVRGDAL